jgi:hypothetical protein
MNWNRIEGYVKNDAKNLLSKLFGITTKNQKAQLKHLKVKKQIPTMISNWLMFY